MKASSSIVPFLFLAACGSSDGKKPVSLVDANTTPPVAPHSKNDMLLITYPEDTGMTLVLTPSADDRPDNNDAALAIPSGMGKHISGEMSAGGTAGNDEYLERDTFLIQTGADVNQLTIRLAWDGGMSDHDFVLVKEITGAEEPEVIASGTAIQDVNNEFSTFVVQPNTKYWLWTGVYQAKAAADEPPVLPAKYDFSIYAENFAGTLPACTTANDFTEAKDTTNDKLTTGAPATNAPETTNLTLTNNTFCGAINTGHFIADAQDPMFGTVDIDQFGFRVSAQTPVIVTLVGATANDKTALGNLSAVEYLILDKDGAYFDRGFFDYDSHGVLTTTLPPTTDAMSMETGPKSMAIIGFNGAAIPANINYRLKIGTDARDTRAPRLTGASDTSEAHDD